MKGQRLAVAACGAVLMGLARLGGAEEPASMRSTTGGRPSVDLAFVVDTTGSMSGLLEAAKAKVWAIANEVGKGKPSPRLRMGLVAYRDRGDSYVTKTVDLSANLDTMYAELLALSAGGGGDGPEHVVQGLEDAVEKMSWSAEPKALKVVFLVGDAPPHEDYPDAPKLDAVLAKAVRRGIKVNAVQCGNWAETTMAWQRIARLGEGRYLAVPQDGGVVARATPFDDRIASLSGRLEGTRMGWGAGKDEAAADMALASRVRGLAAAPAAAERALFKAGAGFGSAGDLAEAVESKTVSLDALKEGELPDELKRLSPAERKARVEKVLAERRALRAELSALQAKRARHLATDAPRKGDAFDGKLVETLKVQAARVGIAY